MKILPTDHVVPFDVDNTLVMWEVGLLGPDIEINGAKLRTNRRNVERIKEMHVKGQYVIVWSAAGYDWAAKVVNALELTQYVDMVMTKPRWYYDDLDSSEWMKRLYE